MWVLFILTVAFAVLTQLLIPTQKAKAGSFEDFDFPRIDDGTPIYYIAGRIRVNSANLIWYGDFFSKPIKKAAGLFKKSIVGYKYYLGWQMAICLGPDVKLLKVWFGQEEPGFEGEVTDGDFSMADPEAFGGETGGGGYDIQCTFYPGSSTQTADPYLQAKIDGGLVPGWRGMAYLVAHGYIGNSTSLQQMSMEVERIPDPLGLGSKATIGSEGDVNPANVIYEMLTNNFGALGIDPTLLNVASFLAGGNTFYDEDEGISVGFGGNAGKISDAFSDIMRQVDATLYEDPLDGQIYLKLIRQDYDIDTIPRLTVSNVQEMSSYAINLWGDTKNKVRVNYTDRSRDYKADAVAVAEDMANIAFQNDEVKPTTTEYPHVKRSAHANRIAARDLNIYSTPIANIRLSSLRFDLNLRPGSVIALDYPEYEISNLILRVKKADLGDLVANRLLLDLVSDKFAKTDAVYGVPGPSLFVKPSLRAATITVAMTMEAPRWFVVAQDDVIDPDAPRIMGMPKRPNTAQSSYDIYGRIVGEADYDDLATEVAFPEYGTLQTSYPLSYDYDTTTGIELATLDDPEVLANVTASQISTLGLNLILIDDEIIGFETYEVNMSDRYVLKGIRRALLDTVPAAHSAGARVVWLYADAVGAREFAVGDDVEAVLASKAPRGAQTAATGLHMDVPEVV